VSEKGKSYFKAPAGLPLVQHALLCLFDLAKDRALTYEKIVEKTSHAVADIFGVVDRGYVREGYFADLVLVDPYKQYAVSSLNLLAKCHWSPFEGHTFSSTIDTTIVNGTIAYQDGVVSDEIAGQRLDCNRSR
jgi:dihydroorotase